MGGFRFKVEKAFTVPGRGVVVSGKVEEGKVSVDQVVGFLDTGGQWRNAVVAAIEVEQRLAEEAQAGERASLLLSGVKKKQVPAGTVLLEPPPEADAPTARRAEPAPEPAVRTSYPAAPKIPTSAHAPSARPIEPASGSWRLALLLAAGLLILLLLLFSLGKLDPLKKRVETRPARIEAASRFLPAGVNSADPMFREAVRIGHSLGRPAPRDYKEGLWKKFGWAARI
jgi:hypothetical protein